MTGTAQEVTRELSLVYRLNVVRIPTNRPVRRRNMGDLVYASKALKWEKITESIGDFHRQQRPVSGRYEFCRHLGVFE